MWYFYDTEGGGRALAGTRQAAILFRDLLRHRLVNYPSRPSSCRRPGIASAGTRNHSLGNELRIDQPGGPVDDGFGWKYRGFSRGLCGFQHGIKKAGDGGY
jgi:hypothetical protein